MTPATHPKIAQRQTAVRPWSKNAGLLGGHHYAKVMLLCETQKSGSKQCLHVLMAGGVGKAAQWFPCWLNELEWTACKKKCYNLFAVLNVRMLSIWERWSFTHTELADLLMHYIAKNLTIMSMCARWASHSRFYFAFALIITFNLLERTSN